MENSFNRVTAVLGPTNTGKTHLAIETMLEHKTGVFGLPLRLLARENYDNTIARFETNKFNSMKDVVNCFNKIISLKKKTAGGRNFSVESDAWGQPALEDQLLQDENMYKLRRRGNDWGCGKK